MTPKIRNIIIFTGIAAAFILIYIFFIRSAPQQENLVSSAGNVLPKADDSVVNISTLNKNSLLAKDFLALLLSVKNIKLDDAIFSDLAFKSLSDSSITLTPDGNEGRSNPFAQFGNDSAPTTPTTPTTPIQTKP